MAKQKKLSNQMVIEQELPMLQIKCKGFVKHPNYYLVDLCMDNAEDRDKALTDVIQARMDHGATEIKITLNDGEKEESFVGWILNYYPWKAFMNYE